MGRTATINAKKLAGRWRPGFTLDYNTVRSVCLGDNQFGHPEFDTTRTEIGELLHLFRAPLVTGFEHLERLCTESVEWHNEWRPHMTLGGATPNDFYGRDLPEPLARDAKVVPSKVERRLFAETPVTGFRLPKAA